MPNQVSTLTMASPHGLSPGDMIVSNGQAHIVVSVDSETTLTVRRAPLWLRLWWQLLTARNWLRQRFRGLALWFLLRVPTGRFGERVLIRWALGAKGVQEIDDLGRKIRETHPSE